MALYSSKADAKRKIQALIDRNDEAVCRGILAIYAYQTAEEQSMGVTVSDNGVGFNGCDAEILTSFAKQFKARGFLSRKQVALGRKKIRRYWRQLSVIAEAKKAEKVS